MSEDKTVSVRSVDSSLWRQFSARAREQDITISALLQNIIRDWLLRVRRETRRDR